MPDPASKHDRNVTTLSLEQREWIRRQGRLARALEAAQRRPGQRFSTRVTAPGGAPPQRPPARSAS